jgi:hypothetical protein
MNDLDLLKCTFPILRSTNYGKATEYSFCGTGFFIDREGTFLSASHVFGTAPLNSKFYFLNNRANGWNLPPLEIDVIKDSCSKDLLVGRVRGYESPALTISDTLIPIDSNVRMVGYPEFELGMSADGKFDFGNMKDVVKKTSVLHNDCRFTDAEHYPCNVDCLTILAFDVSEKGMSGGPIVSEKGVVQGVLTGFVNVNGANRAAAARFDEIQSFLK